jgi:dihydroorotate dehydrogenase electron transfer subunit
LHGGGSGNQLAGKQYFSQLGAVYRASTLDGSYGCQGLVTDLMDGLLAEGAQDYVYMCGPEGMMAAAAGIAERYGLPGEASLEAFMGCAVGACLGCARKMKKDDAFYVKVCQVGPVFNLAALDW